MNLIPAVKKHVKFLLFGYFGAKMVWGIGSL